MKKKLAILFVVTFAIVSALVVSPIGVDLINNTSAEETVTATCPSGSYQIGFDTTYNKPICKNEPTGCPWGDSIPLDSPKCVPPSDVICNEDYTKCELKTESESNNGSNIVSNDNRNSESQEKQSSGSTCSN